MWRIIASKICAILAALHVRQLIERLKTYMRTTINRTYLVTYPLQYEIVIAMKLSANLRGFIRGKWSWPIFCSSDSETQEMALWGVIIKQFCRGSRSVKFTFRPKFRLLPSEVGLGTRIFENGTASFGRTGPTGQRGPSSGDGPLFPENFHLDRNVPLMFRLIMDWHNGKHPWSHFTNQVIKPLIPYKTTLSVWLNER